MSESSGKAARGLGFSVVMLGAGLVLDRGALHAGVAMMIVGWASFMWGMLALRWATQPPSA